MMEELDKLRASVAAATANENEVAAGRKQLRKDRRDFVNERAMSARVAKSGGKRDGVESVLVTEW